MEGFGRILDQIYYRRRRALKQRRKAEPAMKFSPLHSLLKGHTKITGPLRIRMPADYSKDHAC